MPPVPSPVREPAPPLRAVLELPLRQPLGDALRRRIEALEQRVLEATPPEGWAPVYVEAIGAAEAVAAEVDGRLEALQTDMLGLEDPNELKQRLAQGPRREAERTKTDVKAALGKLVGQWTDRTGRQHAQVLRQLVEEARAHAKTQASEQDGRWQLGFDPGWLSRFTQHAVTCASQWGQQATRDTEAALEAAARELLEPLARDKTLGLPAPGRAPGPPEAGWQPTQAPPSEPAELPSVGAALFQQLRTNVMSVGMLAMLGGGVWAFLGTLGGNEAQAGVAASPALRGGLILVSLPVLAYVGYARAQKARVKAREKASQQQSEKLQSYLAAEVKHLLDDHKKALDRWIKARADAWLEAVERWFRDAVEPTFGEADAQVQQAVRELKLQHGRLNDELMALKSFRNTLRNNLLVDLKKRARQLELEG